MKHLYNNQSAISHQKCFLILLLLFTFILCHPTAGAAQKPVAKVNNTVLTGYDLEEAFNEIMPAGVFHGGFSSEKRMARKPEAIDKMIEKELLYQEALKIGLKADNELIKKAMEKAVTRFGSRKKFKLALKKAGLSEKQYREKHAKKDLVEKIIKTEVEDKAKVTDETVATYYNKNKQRLIRPKAQKVRHILVSVKPSANAEERKLRKERAQEVLDKIEAGEDMATLAWDYSDDKYRVKGGDLGYVHQGRLEPELESELNKLKVGQLSGIVKTRSGYHIVKLEGTTEPKQLSLEEASPNIKKMLMENKSTKLHEALLTRLKKEAKIEVY